MSYRVFKRDATDGKGDNDCGDEGLFSFVLDGLRLIEKDALGGAGSRGCGQVQFKILHNGEFKSLDSVSSIDFPTVA